MKKRILGLVVLLTCFGIAQAKVLLTENFDYPVGTNLTDAANWSDVATKSNSKIKVMDGAMTYPGYQSVVVGNAIQLNTGKFQDVKVSIEQTTQTIAYSMLINVSEATDAGDLVFALQSGAGGFFGTKDVLPLAIKAGSSDNKFVMGTCYSGSNTRMITYTTQEFDYNTDYLVVVEYEIVPAGDMDDHVRLFVNETNHARPILNLYGVDLGTEVSTTDGFSAFQIYQGKNFSGNGPQMTIDALRIFTDWNDVFAPAAPTPEISINPASEMNFRSMVCGIERTKEITISGKNLTAPIELSGLSSIFTLSKSTISIDEAQADGGCKVQITLNPTQGSPESGSSEELSISTKDGQPLVMTLKWYATATTQFDNIKAYKEAGQAISTAYLIKSAMTVTLRFELPSPTDTPYKCVCVQDATGALILRDDVGALSTSLAIGDQFPYLYGFAKHDLGTIYFSPSLEIETTKAEVVTPVDVTIKELQANPTQYTGMLVRLEKCRFTPSKPITNFELKSYVKVAQGEDYLTLRMFAGTDYLGEAIPSYGTVVGCIITGDGRRMAMRTKEDIIDIPNAVEDVQSASVKMWTSNGTLFIDNEGKRVEIYDIFGRLVKTSYQNKIQLDNGAYIVKCNAQYTKIVIQ